MNKNIYLTIGSIIVALGLIIFAFYYSKCQGNECEGKRNINKNNSVAEKSEEELFPKLIPSDIKEKLKNNEIFLLDVRENSEWEEGHIEGARHIPLASLDIKTTKDLPKDIPIYIYCRSGRRAGEAEIKLKSLGFEKVENIGGVIYWQGRGGELVK